MSLVEAADRAVPALLAEPEVSGAPPPPRFLLSQEDYDWEAKKGIFEEPLESKEEKAGGSIPGESSILDALADDPTDPPEKQ